MFSSLRSRLGLSYAILIATVLGILGISLILYLARNPANERQLFSQLAAVSQGLPQIGAQPLEELPLPRLQEALGRIDERTGFRLLVLSPEGRLLADTRTEASQIGSQPVLLGEGRGLVRDSAGMEWIYTARQFPNGFTLVAAAPRPNRLGQALPAFLNILGDELLTPFLQAGLIALILAVILAIGMARWISDPLQKIAGAARAVAQGQVEELTPEGPREVQSLAFAFNEMTRKVDDSQQSQRDFVANVSHELKTPLTSIQGFAQALLDGTVQSQEGVHQAAEVIYAESARMHRMVVDLLDLARLDGGTMEFSRVTVDLNLLLAQISENMKPLATDAEVSLDIQLSPLPIIIGDRDRLSQVFTNLLDNAIKYTPAGGHILIRGVPTAEGAQISLSDTGPGIPNKEIDRIFERFYQLDKSRSGARARGVGLGLTIAAEIIQAHGGQLYVESQPGQGSTFFVDLPRAKPDDSTLIQQRKAK